MTRIQKEQMLSAHAARLSEHFGSVTIITTSPHLDPGGGTELIVRGAGDWFARHGAARAWVRGYDAQDLAEEISRALPPPPDDGGGWKGA